jgi:hypothetical protein
VSNSSEIGVLISSQEATNQLATQATDGSGLSEEFESAIWSVLYKWADQIHQFQENDVLLDSDLSKLHEYFQSKYSTQLKTGRQRK